MGDAHPLAAAAGGGLDHHGIANGVGNLDRVLLVFDDAEEARHGRDVGFRRRLLGFDLVAHRGDRVRIGPDEDDSGLLQRARKRLALRQETVAGMDGLGAGALAGIHDPVDQQVAFGGRRRPDRDRLIGHLDVERVAVGLGIHGYRLDPHVAGRLDDATGDLAAICDQNLFEHVFLGLWTLGLPRNLAREGRRNNLSYSKLGRWQYPTCRKSAWPDFDPAYLVLARCRRLQNWVRIRFGVANDYS